MATAFAEWGVQSHICASAQEALDAIASHPDRWSRLVLDLRLGTGMNGLELAAMLAERGFRPTRIMLVTAEPDGETLAQARERGFLVLRKPVKMVRLRAFIESHGATNI
jgi:CheY-like chemotaxis protein